MQHSENIADLMAALVLARKDFKAVHRNAANPFFKSKYPDLSEIVGATHEALMGQGLSVIQSPGSFADHNIYLTTMLAHISGQWMRDTFAMPIVKVDPQGVGAAVSYARRYSLQAFLNIAADLDDDAESAVVHEKAEIRKPQALRPTDTTIAPQKLPPPHDQDMPVSDLPRTQQPEPARSGDGARNGEYISDGQRKRMWAIAKDRGMEKSAVKNIYGRYGAEDDFHIPWKCYKDIMAQIDVPHA